MTATLREARRRLPPGSVALRWLRKNLFRNALDSVLTLIFGGLGLYLMVRLGAFVFANARWEIIDVNLKLLLVGRWPTDRLRVIGVSIVVLGLLGGLIGGVIAGRQKERGAYLPSMMTPAARVSDLSRRFGLMIATVLLVLALTATSGPWLMAGAAVAAGLIGRVGGERMARLAPARWVSRATIVIVLATLIGMYVYLTGTVPLESWEGFFFNISVAAASIILCFPLGVLLALGRRSKLRLIQGLSVLYIEFIRAAPLYVLLLMANVSLEFFVPAAIAPSKVIRAVVTFTLFTAAYLAEIVRGGLQSVPIGQEEAAKSLGLTPTKQMGLIVLPQALRNVIPAQIGQFISLFKDTTLAGLALGIFDFLRGAQAVTQQDAFRGQRLIIETLVFIGFIFWVGSFTMSRESQRLERRLGVGQR